MIVVGYPTNLDVWSVTIHYVLLVLQHANHISGIRPCDCWGNNNMICVHTQMFTNNHRLLRNSPSWPQFKIRLSPYFISSTIFLLFTQQPCQIIARRIKTGNISLVNLPNILFIYLLIRPITRAEAVTPVSV